MRKPRKLKIRPYAVRMSEFNEYFDIFTGAKAREKNWRNRIE